jgi:hypothetical protein
LIDSTGKLAEKLVENSNYISIEGFGNDIMQAQQCAISVRVKIKLPGYHEFKRLFNNQYYRSKRITLFAPVATLIFPETIVVLTVNKQE